MFEVGQLVLFVPHSRKAGAKRWVKVLSVKKRTGFIQYYPSKDMSFDLDGGHVEGRFELLGTVYKSTEAYEEICIRQALGRTVGGRLAQAGVVDCLSDDLLKALCVELGVRRIPLEVWVPDKPEELAAE